jgi:hypothetical protein
MARKLIKALLREFFSHKLNQIGLITAENPQEVETGPEFNNQSNESLLADLQSLGYDVIPASYFGENCYLVPNISMRHLIDLGFKYNQKAVLHGRKVPEDRNGMTFAWKNIVDGKIMDEKISHHPYTVPEFD